MKKLINLFFLLLALTTMSLISCSKNEIENDVFEYDIPDGNRELYDQITSELYDYLYSHEDATIEDLQEQLKKYSTSVTSEVKHNILYLKIDSTYDFMCDPYRMTGGLDSEENEDSLETDLNLIDREIRDALYPEEAPGYWGVRHINNGSISQKTRSNDGFDVLNKKRVMIWNPWNISDVKELMRDEIKDIRGLIKIKSFFYETLDDLKSMDQYDVVFLCCHGDPEGDIWMPATIKERIMGYFGRGPSTHGMARVNRTWLDNNIPNLSKTVLWTAICWGDKSYLKSVAVDKRHCVAFSGADNFCRTNLPDTFFGPFLFYFYNYYTEQNAADWALPNYFFRYPSKDDYINNENQNRGNDICVPYRLEPETLTVDMKSLELYQRFGANVIKRINENKVEIEIPCNGNYYFHCYNNSSLTGNVLIEAMASVEDRMMASITVPFEWFASASASRGFNLTRSSSSNVSAGFWVRNKETKEEIEIEFSDSTVVIYANDDNPKYYPKDNNLRKEIVRVEVLGKTDNLAPGTYEYRTYLEIDGEKEYSDSIYEFTVMDIKHLSCPDYNHPHLIDLGLPSGTKWLCCNLGVDNLVNTGHYFAWGVTLPYDKNDYQLMHYPRFYYPYSECHGGSDLDLAYQWDGDIYTDIGNNISGTAYDAAYTKSNLIRMPTKEDFEELIESCAFLMGPVCISDGTSSNLLYSGSVAIGPNGNMIALPIANYWTGTLSKEEESGGALLAYPRVNGISGSAYSFVGEDVNYTSVSLDESVKLLLHYIKDDEVDQNIYYFIGSKFYMPSIAPKKRFHPYYIRPVGR